MKVNIDWNRFDSDAYRPLITEEIPDFNPGTIAYDDFWDEQDKRCIEGFKPRPFMPKIANEHYFYLNMCKISLLQPGASRKSTAPPFYRELDRMLFTEIVDAKKHRHGLIVGKPRRVGLSWVGATSMVYELIFYLNNTVGVAAGQEDKAADFYGKVKDLLRTIRPQYAVGIAKKDDEQLRLGYTYTENQQRIESGIGSKMFIKTMYANPSGFEGKEFGMVVFEEAGLFVDIIAAFKASEPCFKEGSIWYGIPLIYGTGGDIEKGSAGYMKMWKAPKETYNLKKVMVLATDYYPGDGVPDPVTKEKVSFFDFRTGRTDARNALDYIMAEREAKKGSEGYVKHIQSYPVKESEIFIKSSGGLLDRRKLSAQLNRLEECPFLKQTGSLEWETNDPTTKRLVSRAKDLKELDKIHYQRKSKLVFVPDKIDVPFDEADPDDRKNYGPIKILLHPMDSSNLPFHPDIGGTDSYDDEVAAGTGSDGATIIYRTFHGITSPHDIPIAYTLDRGTSDNNDEFYSNTFRLTHYYKSLKGDHICETLLEWTKTMIKTHFDDVGAGNLLKGRPDLSESGYNSRAVNQRGFKVSNSASFKLIVRLLRQEVKMNFQNIWWKEILEHLIDFGDTNADLASAYGMVLVSKLDMFGELTEGIETPEGQSPVGDLLLNMGYWAMENGKAVWKTYGEPEYGHNGEFDIDGGERHIFNPEYDLEGIEKQKYEQNKRDTRARIKKEQQQVLDKYGGDPMAFVLEEHQRRLKSKN